jgi:hypothetical protein
MLTLDIEGFYEGCWSVQGIRHMNSNEAYLLGNVNELVTCIPPDVLQILSKTGLGDFHQNSSGSCNF